MFRSKENIGNWIQTNQEAIQTALERHRQNLIRETGDDHVFDTSRRELSEMPLCGAVHEIIPPPGFRVPEDGEAIVGPYNTNHAYLSDGTRVIDPTVGQFFIKEPLSKGSAMSELRQKAPELFVQIGGEVSVLYGDVETIQEKLGIKYK